MSEDAYTDERGETWTRPTAEAYAKVCTALHQREGEIVELTRDLEEAYRLNSICYRDGYAAAAGPRALERIERLQWLWEGCKSMNRELLAERAAAALP